VVGVVVHGNERSLKAIRCSSSSSTRSIKEAVLWWSTLNPASVGNDATEKNLASGSTPE
jgi:hypothetical protein